MKRKDGLENYSVRPPYQFHVPGTLKKLHLIRHAQGHHNKAKEETGSREAYNDWRWVDAQLTNKGHQQTLQTKASYFKSFPVPDLVVVSPLARTLETATNIFGESEVPFVALEAVRERYGVHPCDKRSPLTVLVTRFPKVDFSQITSEEDKLWKEASRETRESIHARALQFLAWVAGRPESTIALVSHQDFLHALLTAVDAPMELQGRFENCEHRLAILS
eukprot:Ihof_evm6s107 gene=Ihof_evmTU6s107